MAKYNESTLKAISIAKWACERSGGILSTEHLLIGLLKNGGETAHLLSLFNIDSKNFEENMQFTKTAKEAKFSEEAERALNNAKIIVLNEGGRTISDISLLYAILLDSTCNGAKILSEKGVFYMNVKRIKDLLNMGIDIKYFKDPATQNSETKTDEKSEDFFSYYKITDMEQYLKTKIIGQDEIISTVCGVLKRSYAGLTDGKRPLGSFLFCGTTGVGKTELAKAISEYLFGSDGLVFLDMSEYSEQSAASRLIGAAPGYVGYEEGGQLTEAVFKRKKCVVLFDEIEKAHSSIYNLLLQILEEGRLTDSKGKVVTFENTVIILTSNTGSKCFTASNMGISEKSEENENELRKNEVLSSVKKYFNPELLNRFDEILIFNRLFRKDLIDIFKIMFYNLVKRLEKKGIKLVLNSESIDLFIDSISEKEYGARKIRREIIRQIEIPLSDLILEQKIKSGDRIEFNFLNGKPTLCKTLKN